MEAENREGEAFTASLNSSLALSNNNSSIFEQPKIKAKCIRILTVNFQSICNKKEELETFLMENDIDVVLGSESHLSPSINNSEIVPPLYTAYRKDRDDGWGGVIIIVKKSLIVEGLQLL